MRGARYLLLCVAVLGALSMLGPASAVAASCGGSAGDSQYVDPLQNCGGGHSGATHSGGHRSTSHVASGSSSQTTTVADTSTSSAQPAAATTTTSAGATAAKKDPKGGGSLPFTGLDLVSALILAAALIAGGVWLRWVGRERRPHWR